MRVVRGISCAIVASCTMAGTASAQEDPVAAEAGEPTAVEEQPLDVGQRNFGFVATAGTFLGMAGGIRAGTPAFGVQGTCGWSLTLQGVEEPDDEVADLRVFSGYLVSGDLYARALATKKGSSAGVVAGYRYFSVLGHGFALGGYGLMRLNRAVDGFVSAGFVLYPDAEDRLRRTEDIPPDADFAWPGPTFSTHVNLGIYLFP